MHGISAAGEGRLAEPRTSAEGRLAEPRVAAEGHLVEPGVAGDGRPAESGAAVVPRGLHVPALGEGIPVRADRNCRCGCVGRASGSFMTAHADHGGVSLTGNSPAWCPENSGLMCKGWR